MRIPSVRTFRRKPERGAPPLKPSKATCLQEPEDTLQCSRNQKGQVPTQNTALQTADSNVRLKTKARVPPWNSCYDYAMTTYTRHWHRPLIGPPLGLPACFRLQAPSSARRVIAAQSLKFRSHHLPTILHDPSMANEQTSSHQMLGYLASWRIEGINGMRTSEAGRICRP